jgi:hypothetical protein
MNQKVQISREIHLWDPWSEVPRLGVMTTRMAVKLTVPVRDLLHIFVFRFFWLKVYTL